MMKRSKKMPGTRRAQDTERSFIGIAVYPMTKAMIEELVARERKRRRQNGDPRTVSRVDIVHQAIKAVYDAT